VCLLTHDISLFHFYLNGCGIYFFFFLKKCTQLNMLSWNFQLMMFLQLNFNYQFLMFYISWIVSFIQQVILSTHHSSFKSDSFTGLISGYRHSPGETCYRRREFLEENVLGLVNKFPWKVILHKSDLWSRHKVSTSSENQSNSHGQIPGLGILQFKLCKEKQKGSDGLSNFAHQLALRTSPKVIYIQYKFVIESL